MDEVLRERHLPTASTFTVWFQGSANEPLYLDRSLQAEIPLPSRAWRSPCSPQPVRSLRRVWGSRAASFRSLALDRLAAHRPAQRNHSVDVQGTILPPWM